jgi:hypothetical protein
MMVARLEYDRFFTIGKLLMIYLYLHLCLLDQCQPNARAIFEEKHKLG